MIEWVETETGTRCVGRGGVVTLVTDGWTPAGGSVPLPYPAEVGRVGRVDTLKLDARAMLADGRTAGSIPAGENVLRTADAGLNLAVRFNAPAQLTHEDGWSQLAFDNDTAAVAIGVSDAPPAPESLSVPATPAGLARAITIAGRQLPAGPERSFAPARPHPPVIEYDADAPAQSPEPTASRSIELRIPDDLEHVLVAAPLAYYLGARLNVEADAAPLVRIPELGFEYAFNRLPAFASETAVAVRRAVHLDRCARELGGRADTTALSELGLEPAAVRAVDPAVRYATFLEASLEALPEWHLSTYVDPTYERARALPALLDRLSLIYPAEATELSPRELLQASLDDFYRGAVSVSPLAPELGVGTAHGWLADGEVVDAFKPTPAAYEHARMDRPTGDALSVVVILNDPEMDAELAVADAYHDRGGVVPVDMTVHESLSRAELASALESPCDFLHYVGHCETDGLQCRDGYLSVETLSTAGPRAFFLNACGSYHEGEALVEQGSIAGAVTLEQVLNEQAARVGTAFGRLVVTGYSIDRALDLARRRIMMGRDYAAVGDGTARVAPAVGERAVLTIEPDGDRYAVEFEAAPGAGGEYRDPFSGTVRARGDPARTTLDADELASFLTDRALPVQFDGDLRWAGALAEAVRPRQGRPL